MKKVTYTILICTLSLVAALEITICLFIPDRNFDGGLAGGAIAGAIATAVLLITATAFVALITISLVLKFIMGKRKIVGLYLILSVILLPAWGVVQYNREPGNSSDPIGTEQERRLKHSFEKAHST
jgi:Zn-dependent protease with chaperone function